MSTCRKRQPSGNEKNSLYHFSGAKTNEKRVCFMNNWNCIVGLAWSVPATLSKYRLHEINELFLVTEGDNNKCTPYENARNEQNFAVSLKVTVVPHSGALIASWKISLCLPSKTQQVVPKRWCLWRLALDVKLNRFQLVSITNLTLQQLLLIVKLYTEVLWHHPIRSAQGWEKLVTSYVALLSIVSFGFYLVVHLERYAFLEIEHDSLVLVTLWHLFGTSELDCDHKIYNS